VSASGLIVTRKKKLITNSFTLSLLPFLLHHFRYQVDDSSNNAGSSNFTYYISVCSNLDPIKDLPASTTIFVPAQGVTIPACNITFPGSGIYPQTPNYGPAPAFQFNQVPGATPPDACHRLGAPVSQNNEIFGLYDTSNPSRGVSLQYTGGDSCGGTGGIGKYRSLKLWLLCDPLQPSGVPDNELILEAPGSCLYEIFVRTTYGCPAECPIASGSAAVCNNHGFCEFDNVLKTSKCFCNDGYGGSDCSAPTQPTGGLSTVGGLLIAVCLFLFGTLGFLVYLWFRIRTLRLDPTAYSSLRAGPEDAATGTAIQ
jgi:hypothetical protein